MANKVKYNLKNVYYAVATISTDGSATYTTPVAWKGAVNLTLDAENAECNFYADGIKYFSAYGNNGYTGSLETAMIPDSFKTDVLGEVKDDKDVYIEKVDTAVVHFALMFEFDGDANAVKHVLYNCVASRPSIESSTKEDSIEVKTDTVNITATSIYNSKIGSDIVKGRCDDASADPYATWTTAVYQPTA